MEQEKIKQVFGDVNINLNKDDTDSDLDEDIVSKHGDEDTSSKRPGIPPEAKEIILKYSQIDSIIQARKADINKINKEVKEMKILNQMNENYIIKLLENLGEKVIELNASNEKITKCTTKVKGALKSEYIKNTLMELLNNEETTNELLKKIEDKRPITFKHTLKRQTYKV